MALSSEDFQQLKLTLEDLTRAERDLATAFQRSANGGGAQGGPAAAATPTVQPSAAAGAGATSLGAALVPTSTKADSASGFGLSAARQLLSAAGAGGAASLVGGLASGPVPLIAAGVGQIRDAVGDVIERPLAAARSGLAAFTKSPTTDTEKMAKFRGRQAVELSELESDEKTDHNVRGMLMYGPQELAQRDFSRAQRRRQIAQESDDTLGPQESALERTRRQLEGFAAAGGMRAGKGGDAGRQLADHLYQFNLRMANNMQDFDRWARVRDMRLSATSPGNASAQAGY